MIKFCPLGGADEVGANSFYLNIYGTGIILDCGIHPRKLGADALPNFELISDQPVDYVIVSHAHQDHIGALPYLIQKFPHLIIYSTPQTLDIAKITLHNSVNILTDRLDADSYLHPYTHDEVDLLLRSFQTADYGTTFGIKGLRQTTQAEIKATFYDAGHILGSSGILIEAAGQKIFYTGDINMSPQIILAGAELPQDKIDTLILESTYAATDSDSLGSLKNELARMVKKANKILERGGSILMPVFALGKTQEILMALNELMNQGKLTEANIYTGGLGKKLSNVYDANRFKVKRKRKREELKDIPQNNIYDITDLNSLKKKQAIILASSGMMIQGTFSYKMLDFWLKQEDFGIFIVGYMDPETPGFLIENAQRGRKISFNGSSNGIEVKCDIERFYFPSHTKREDLIKIVDILKPNRVVIIHGEKEGIDWLGVNILNEFPGTKVHAPESGKWIIFD